MSTAGPDSDSVSLLELLATDPTGWSGQDRVSMLGRLQRLRGWLDAREAAVLAVVHTERDDVNSGAKDLTQLCQRQAGVGYGEAKRREVRALWLAELPAAAAALAAGQLGTAHADELCHLAERLDADKRPALIASHAELAHEIAEMTPASARRRLQEFETSLDDSEADATDRLERQKAASRLCLIKQRDGTSAVTGQLDPVAAAVLRKQLDARVNEIWRRQQDDRGSDPDRSAPSESFSNDRLSAEALLELVSGGSGGTTPASTPARVVAVVDHKTLLNDLAEGGISRLADGTPIPPSEIRKLACNNGILPAVFGTASTPLDAGRNSRTATPAQRAILAVMHPSCAVEGCEVPFDHCDIHHITWWRNNGKTDLDNLVPLCSSCHTQAHHPNWRLEVATDRTAAVVARTRPPPGSR